MLRAHRNRSPRSASCGPQPAPRTVCPACDPRQSATAFNQPLSWDTSRVTEMSWMFYVRCSPPPPPKSVVAPSLTCTLRAHTPQSPAASRPPPSPGPRHATSPLHARGGARASPLIPCACPLCDSAGGKLPVRRQQAAHPLRVGGHPGLRLRWLWLELGAGKLRLKPLLTSSEYSRAGSLALLRDQPVWSRLASATTPLLPLTYLVHRAGKLRLKPSHRGVCTTARHMRVCAWPIYSIMLVLPC